MESNSRSIAAKCAKVALLLIAVAGFLVSDVRLPIFYENGLGSSIFPPVLVGVVVMTLGAELFGWVYSGLLVPGFIAPIIILEPRSAVLMAVEAILSYLFVLGLSTLGTKTDLWSEFFGRERFFAILIVSVGVRLLLEAAVLPHLGILISGEVSSVGFVFVPLLANMFWNSGLRKTFWPVSCSIFLTWLITRYLLIEHTNFSLSRLNLIYEAASIEFASGAKSQIILLTAAYLASRSNILYGWDFNGILVPSLLALVVVYPTKYVATLVEAISVLLIAKFIASRKRFETTTIEGPRKTLFLFTISFLVKMVIDATLGLRWPGLTAIDFYGFGYILSTLMAAKMWQKGASIVLLPILRTSLFAALVGNVLGFTLSFIGKQEIVASTDARARVLRMHSKELSRQLLLSKMRLNSKEVVTPDRYLQFARLFEQLSESQNSGRQDFERYVAELVSLDCELVLFVNDDGTTSDILLREVKENAGFGFVLFSAKPHNSLLIYALDAHRNLGSLQLADKLYRKLGAGILIATEKSEVGNLLCARSEMAVLELRSRVSMTAVTTVNVKNCLPEALSLTELRSLLGDFNLVTDAPLIGSSEGYVQLIASQAKIDSVLAAPEEVENAYLVEWFFRQRRAVSSVNIAPDEAKFYDEELLRSLLIGADTPSVRSAAKTTGYQLLSFRSGDVTANFDNLAAYKVLRSVVGNQTTVVINKRRSGLPVIIEVPRPFSEPNALLFAFQLMDYLDAWALIISGSDENDALFDIAHRRVQSLMSSAGQFPLVVQVRSSIGERYDVVLNAGFELTDISALTPAASKFVEKLQYIGQKIAFYDGSLEMLRYAGKQNTQARYSARFPKSFLTLWKLTPLPVSLYEEAQLSRKRLAMLGVSQLVGDFRKWATTQKRLARPTDISDVISALARYSRYHNINDLEEALSIARRIGFTTICYYDGPSCQTFLVLLYGDKLAYVLRLSLLADDKIFKGANDLDRFVYDEKLVGLRFNE
ncbi:MAG: poly-gamma-glutamate biosynthesis protein PgsC/CapC [Acidobacteriota bacterium]|nr:poly-gamma-glutamate biosynthesis protein PgsC/CapC [Blastocatellia bacterium]MDW8411204.1 poly-gamma-glutamate biosynthesis protein PgsC/CapC [Acidobacteriota bacterium]